MRERREKERVLSSFAALHIKVDIKPLYETQDSLFVVTFRLF